MNEQRRWHTKTNGPTRWRLLDCDAWALFFRQYVSRCHLILILATSPMLLCFSCHSAISPGSVRARVDWENTSIARIQWDRDAASYKYVSSAVVTRSRGIIRIRLLQRDLHRDKDKNIEVPEVAVFVYPTDREIRLTDGTQERTIWSSSDGRRSSGQPTTRLSLENRPL